MLTGAMQSITMHLGRARLLPGEQDVWISLAPGLDAWHVSFARPFGGMPDAPLPVRQAVRVRPVVETRRPRPFLLVVDWQGADDFTRAVISAGTQRAAVALAMSLQSYSGLCQTWLVDWLWSKLACRYKLPAMVAYAASTGHWFVAFADDQGRPYAMVVPVTESSEDGRAE